MIRVGTCSWADRSIIESGSFYPKRIKSASARLAYYASIFDTVEIDATYYALPRPQVAQLWVERTPENFLFHVKAYAALTGHTVEPKTLPLPIQERLEEKEKNRPYIFIHDPGMIKSLARYFQQSIAPLGEAKKLGLVVFQFPPWFRYGPSGLEQILSCRRLMEGYSLGVEFRHGSWLKEERRKEVFSFLRENGLTYITADEPQFSDDSTVPFVPEATTDIVYLRLHGRNATSWRQSNITTSLRYDYLYSEEELEQFRQVAEQFAQHNVFVMFNNCHAGQAMRNALRLKALLSGKDIYEEPETLF